MSAFAQSFITSSRLVASPFTTLTLGKWLNFLVVTFLDTAKMFQFG